MTLPVIELRLLPQDCCCCCLKFESAGVKLNGLLDPALSPATAANSLSVPEASKFGLQLSDRMTGEEAVLLTLEELFSFMDDSWELGTVVVDFFKSDNSDIKDEMLPFIVSPSSRD